MSAQKEKVFGDTKLGRDGLTDKQRAFVSAYTGESHDGEFAGKPADALLAAGYAPGDKPNHAHAAAWALLQRPHIQAAVKHYAETLAGEDGIGPEYVKRRLYRLSKSNFEGLLTVEASEDGTENEPKIDWVKMVECGGVEWIKKYTTEETFDKEGNKKIRRIIELHDPVAPLQTLAKMFGLLNDKVIHTGPDGGPIQHENKFVIDAANDPESFELFDRLSQRMALKPGGAGEQTN